MCARGKVDKGEGRKRGTKDNRGKSEKEGKSGIGGGE